MIAAHPDLGRSVTLITRKWAPAAMGLSADTNMNPYQPRISAKNNIRGS